MEELLEELRGVRVKVEQVMTWLALSLVYIVGVGGSSMVGKIIGKEFLPKANTRGNWRKYKESGDLEKMF